MWGYNPTFGHYPLGPTLAQPSYYQLLHTPSIDKLVHIILFCYVSSQPQAFSSLWESTSSLLAPHTSIIPEKRIRNTATSIKRGERTCSIRRGNRKSGKSKSGASKAISQFIIPSLEVFLTLERKILENNSDGEGETNELANRQQKRVLT